MTCLIDEKLLRSTTLSIIKFVMEVNTGPNGWNSMFCQWCRLAPLQAAQCPESKTEPISRTTTCTRATTSGRRVSPAQETDITSALLSITGRWWHIKYSPWRMAGERKQPETRPSFYWVMDIFSKEPSRAALLKVTELTLSMDNINDIVDVTIPSFIFPSLLKLLFLCLWGEWGMAEKHM